MQHAALASAIRKGEVKPAYLLCDARPFVIDAVLDALREVVGAGGAGGLACETLYGTETTGEKVRAAAREVPMLAPRRLMIVREAAALAKRNEDVESLLAYLDRPSPTTVLALVAAEFDLRTKLAKRIEQVGAVLRPEKVNAGGALRFAREHGRALGIDVSTDAAAALVDLAGDDLGAIHDALSKLALSARPGLPVDAQDVNDLVAPSRRHSVFELVDAFAGRDVGAALALVAGLVEHGEAPLKVLGLLARQIRLLIYAKSDPEHPRVAALQPFVRRKVQQQASRFTMRALVGAVEAVQRADIALKSSAREDTLVLEQLVLEVARPGPHAGAGGRRRGAERSAGR